MLKILSYNNTFLRLFIFFSLLFCIPITGCQKQTEEKKVQDIKNVRVAKVKEREVEDIIEVTGTIYPQEEVTISNKKSGKVIKILADLGDYVQKGKLLAVLDPIDYQLQYNESLAQQRSIKASLEGIVSPSDNPEEHTLVKQAKANMDDNYLQMVRLEKLLKDKLIPQQDYDSARSKYLASKALYENRIINVQKLQDELLASKARTSISAQSVSDTNITAPISGFIQKRQVSLGEYLQTQADMFTIVQTNKLKVKASLPEKYAPKVKKGIKVTFTVDAYDNKNFNGTVTRVAPAIDTDTHTFEIEIEVNNKDNMLKPGLFSLLTVDLGTKHKGLFIPETAVYTTVGLNKVFTIENNRPREHQVSLGAIFDDEIEIIGDIKKSDEVINTDVDKLSEEIRVKVVRPKGLEK